MTQQVLRAQRDLEDLSMKYAKRIRRHEPSLYRNVDAPYPERGRPRIKVRLATCIAAVFVAIAVVYVVGVVATITAGLLQ